jgi:hypothetical protein
MATKSMNGKQTYTFLGKGIRIFNYVPGNHVISFHRVYIVSPIGVYEIIYVGYVRVLGV